MRDEIDKLIKEASAKAEPEFSKLAKKLAEKAKEKATNKGKEGKYTKEEFEAAKKDFEDYVAKVGGERNFALMLGNAGVTLAAGLVEMSKGRQYAAAMASAEFKDYAMAKFANCNGACLPGTTSFEEVQMRTIFATNMLGGQGQFVKVLLRKRDSLNDIVDFILEGDPKSEATARTAEALRSPEFRRWLDVYFGLL